MEVYSIASSSKGNAYVIVSVDGGALLVEAGLPFPKLRQNIYYETGLTMNSFSACLITHMHKDHSEAALEISTYMPVIASLETLESAGVTNGIALSEWIPYDNRYFRVVPFKVEHDCPGAYGYMITEKATDENLIFINDCKLVEYDFSQFPFDHVMIECNYNDDLIDLNDIRTKRTSNAHMSLDNCIRTLLKMNLTKTRQIYLMHLSVATEHQQQIIRKVKQATGVPTSACLKTGGIVND